LLRADRAPTQRSRGEERSGCRSECRWAGTSSCRAGGRKIRGRAELLALEIELTESSPARSAATKGAAPAVRTKEKDKIIRALRRLK